MLWGPVRHSFTAKERAVEQGIHHLVYPRYTRIVDTLESGKDVAAAFNVISKSKLRNEQIKADIQECVAMGRTPVILTRQKEQAQILYDELQGSAEYIFLLYGDNTDKVNKEIRPRQEAGVKVSVMLTDPECKCYGNVDFYLDLIAQMQAVGIHVIQTKEDKECFAVIDNELVWHGGMNLLGKVDAWDNLIRIKSESVAQELMGMMQEEMR